MPIPPITPDTNRFSCVVLLSHGTMSRRASKMVMKVTTTDIITRSRERCSLAETSSSKCIFIRFSLSSGLVQKDTARQMARMMPASQYQPLESAAAARIAAAATLVMASAVSYGGGTIKMYPVANTKNVITTPTQRTKAVARAAMKISNAL